MRCELDGECSCEQRLKVCHMHSVMGTVLLWAQCYYGHSGMGTVLLWAQCYCGHSVMGIVLWAQWYGRALRQQHPLYTCPTFLVLT